MAGGGGKGGSQETNVKLPDFVEAAAERAVGRGEQVGRIGFVPNMGPSVAAFNPTQEAAFGGVNQAASAYGMPTSSGTGMPAAQDFGGGISGFSSFPAFEASLAQLQQQRPGQYDAINSFFIDPQTGGDVAAPAGLLGAAPAPAAPAQADGELRYDETLQRWL